MKIITSIFITLCCCNNIQGQHHNWVGYYDYYTETHLKPGAKLSHEFVLQIKPARNKLIAIYTKKENEKTIYQWKLNVKAAPTKATFYFNKILNTEITNPLSAKPLKGNLLFELITTLGNGDPLLYTIWKKPDIIQEAGIFSQGKGIVFFTKRLYTIK